MLLNFCAVLCRWKRGLTKCVGTVVFCHSLCLAQGLTKEPPSEALVISNESGQGGATLSHRQRGEPVAHLNIAFPYWFCANYHHFTGRTEQLPVDGHLLLALIAPRPLFVASAEADPFSDPRGEFLSAAAASKVYRLFGEEGLSPEAKVELGKLVGNVLRYYVRPGGHNILLENWKQSIAFAGEQLRRE